MPFGPPFAQIWNLWICYRRERNLATYKPIGLKSTLADLVKLSDGDEEKAIELIQYAIAKNWQGFYPIKNTNGHAPNARPRQSSTGQAQSAEPYAFDLARALANNSPRDRTKISKAEPSQISNLLNTLQWLLGVNTSKQSQADNDRNLLKFSAFLIAKKGYLTLEEIELAYELACDGELDVDVFPVLNPLHFGRIMKGYQQYRNSRTELVQANRNGLALPEPTPADAEAIMFDSFRLALNAVKENGGCADYGNALYDWLDSKGLIPFDNNRKWEFMNEAADKVKNDAIDRLKNRNLHKDKKQPIRTTLNDFLNNAFSKSTIDRIKVMAKYLALNALLVDLVENQVTVEEYLSESITPQLIEK